MAARRSSGRTLRLCGDAFGIDVFDAGDFFPMIE